VATTERVSVREGQFRGVLVAWNNRYNPESEYHALKDSMYAMQGGWLPIWSSGGRTRIRGS
jgi:hypothetical protein